MPIDERESELALAGSLLLTDYARILKDPGGTPISQNALMGLLAALPGTTPGGRLTLTSGTPITTSNVTGATTVYYTPYTSNLINLWNGTSWIAVAFSEVSLALGTMTASLPYDIFGYLSAGVLTLEKLAWASGSGRATSITLQDGRYCKSGDKTRLYLGSVYSTSTTTVEDSASKRFVFNMYNRAIKALASPVGASHTIQNVGTPREWNNGSGTLPRAEFLVGAPVGSVLAIAQARAVVTTAAINVSLEVRLDTTSILFGFSQIYNSSAISFTAFATFNGLATPANGYHYFTIGEAEYQNTLTTIDNGVAGGLWMC